MAQVLPFRPVDAAPPAPEPSPRRYLGEVLVESGQLAREQVEEALDEQRGQDSLLGHILLVRGLLSPEALEDALSQQSGLGRVDLDAMPSDPRFVAEADPEVCLRLDAVPWRHFAGRRVIAIANPANGGEVIETFTVEGGEPVALAIARPEAIRTTISRHFRARMSAEASTRCPDDLSCRTLLRRGASWRKSAAVAALAGAVALAPWLALHVALLWILVANAATMGLRFVALLARLRSGPQPVAGVPRLVDYRRLPKVSVIVPLWREARVADQLLEALSAMAYPAPLLDIKLVLEEEDETTRAAIMRRSLPPTIEVVTVPRDALRTKPRAMNYALPFCRGEIIGVYDAEDKPDPGQIRAVVQHLMDAGPKVACVQGYLDFYNDHDNWLARCFTIEYAVWFRVLLMGVQRLGLPIPLGGTTVFFRRAALEAIGAWDAHNVTEDADLGMRLARFGFRCEMIPTTTLEEANCHGLGRWIGQRSRWLKGYAITWASHMRDPVRLWRDLGPRGFLGFQVLFLGGMTSYLAMPLFWVLWTGFLGFDLALWDRLSVSLMLVFSSSMILGHVVMLATAAVALHDSGRLRMLPWLLALPFYWPLGALAAYRAIAEVFYAPFHWQKTEHGLHLPDAPAPPRPPAHRASQ
jgi:cellulose synthase/poly-beta-1,6-N-acetylglucosamine synthase-like glycosyltransferase